MDAINLKQLFGDRYRVTYEESYYAERGADARSDDPALQILLCRHGHIYPYGPGTLAASTNKRGAVANALTALSCTTVLQDGDDGVNVAFPVDDFDEIAALLKPRRRKLVPPEERERLAKLGRESLNRYRQANAESQESNQESPDAGRSDSEPLSSTGSRLTPNLATLR